MSNEMASEADPQVDHGQGDGNAGRRRWLLVLALVALAGLAYANAVFHPFVYDDNALIVKNPEIRSLSNIPAMLGFTESGFKPRARWTRDVSYALEYAAVGPKAPVFHFTNIVLHAIVGLLAFALISRIFESTWLGFWTAALFLVHPINTEVVAHVAGRRGLLAAIFSMSALLLLRRYTRVGGPFTLVGAFAAFYLGVFSKELAIMTALAFVAIDFYGRIRSAGGADDAARPSLLVELGRHLAERKVIYASLAIFTIVLALPFLVGDTGVGASRGFYDTEAGGLGPIDRAGLVGMGLRLLLLPVGQSVDYSFDALQASSAGARPLLFVDLTILLLAAGLTVWGIGRRSAVGLAGVWMVVYYLPHAGIISWHEVFAERFLYLSSIGFCLAAAVGGMALAARPGWQRPAAVGGALVLALLGTGTVLRNDVWSSSRALWSDTVNRYPSCARAHKALADTYLADTLPGHALEHYREAARILPRYLDARVGIAVAQTAQRNYAAALESLEGILGRWPTSAKALNLEGYIHQTLGRSDEAMAAYRLAVESDPEFADGYNNLARLYVESGNLETAIAMYEKALEHNPGLVPALKNLAIVYREAFDDEERARYYETQAERLTPIR